MNIKPSNYFKSTPKNIKRWLLALKSFIGTIAGAAYLEGYPKAAFWILIGGAVLDLFSNLIGED